MACDQTHEQTNNLIKSKSGLADVLNKEDSRFLKKLENIIHEIFCYLGEVEGEESYINDIMMVCKRVSILERGAQKVNSKMSNDHASLCRRDMGKVFQIGQEQ